MMRTATGGLVDGRNKTLRTWLDQYTEEWLWSVDTDMGFQGDIVARLLAAADPKERPVVGGLCFGLRHEDPDGFGGFNVSPFPTIFDWHANPDGHQGFAVRYEYERNAVVQCAGTGMACLLIHRSAAEAVRERFGDHWFDPVRYADGRRVSEDLSFCYRLAQVGVPLFVHTGARTTHAKQVWLGEADYLALRALGAAAEATEPPQGGPVDISAQLAAAGVPVGERGPERLQVPEGVVEPVGGG